jgi:hypothetical protein
MATLKNTLINDTGFLTLPNGTTSQRPVSPSSGMIRYNTDLNLVEYWNGTVWNNWLQSQEYIRSITVASTTTTDLQVRVLLTPSNFNYSSCRSDGGDIRFVSSSNLDASTSALTYWIETWNNSGNSIFWVKIPNASTTVFYMKYGNLGRTSLSNIDNTMEAGLRFRYYGVSGTSPTLPSSTLDGGGTDTDINDTWGSGTVIVNGFGTRADGVGVIWDGWVTPSGSGTYTFFGTSDDGQRLYINNTIQLDNWTDRGATENSVNYTWTDNQPKTIRYDWYENAGGADARLGWTPPATGTKVYPIPPSNLRSPKYSSNYNDPYNYVATVGVETV